MSESKRADEQAKQPEEPSRKSVKVQYRSFLRNDQESTEDRKDGQMSLSRLITEALNTNVDGQTRRDFARLRSDDDRQDETSLMLTRCDETGNFIFGELAHFAPGQAIEVIEEARNQKVVDLLQQELRDGHSPIRGIIYFLALDDHIMFIQSTTSASSTLLKQYFSWLLCEATGLLSKAPKLGVKTQVGTENAPPITGVTMTFQSGRGATVPTASAAAEDTERRPAKMARRKITERLEGWEPVNGILEAAGITEDRRNKLRESAGANGEVFATVRVHIRENGKTVGVQKADALDLIADSPADKVQLRDESGTTGDDWIKLTYDQGRVILNGALMVPDDVRRILIEAYDAWLANGWLDGEELRYE